MWAGGIPVPASIRGQCDACLKRLEEGTFRFPEAEAAGVAIRAADLQMLLDGVELDSVKRRRRYRRPVPA